MEQLSGYLKEVFGVQAGVKALGGSSASALPLYLKSGYQLKEGSINGVRIIFAAVKSGRSITPGMLAKQGDLLEKQLKAPAVFVFDKLEAYERKRFIEKKIAFLEPFKQLYIPSLFVELSNVAKRENTYEKNSDQLSLPAQVAVLYHLQIRSLNQASLKELERFLGYSAMTISRLTRELAAFGICEIQGGKEKTIDFKKQGKLLWDQVRPLLASPVVEVWYTDEKLPAKHFSKSGDTALSSYSNLSESQPMTYAVGKEAFREFKEKGMADKLSKQFGDYRIEVWKYDPQLLAAHKKVDRLSLYLAMDGEEDPRVKGALTEMINHIAWSLD